MKTVAFAPSVLLVLSLFTGARGGVTWNLSLDGDARYHYRNVESHDAEIHVAGVQLRTTYADSRGDRLAFSLLAEAYDTFSEFMAHELYLRYKGPLGAWNITAGRYSIPFGLNYLFSATRLLYATQTEMSAGVDADNGLMLSGILGRYDYALSISQGYGAHHMPQFPGHGLASGRLGIALDDTDEKNIGISGIWGRTADHHHPEHSHFRALGAFDGTFYVRQFIVRPEVSAGYVDSDRFGSGQLIVDYAILPRLDLTFSGAQRYRAGEYATGLFTGFTIKPRFVTLRGGYLYEQEHRVNHTVSFQLYRLFAFTF